MYAKTVKHADYDSGFKGTNILFCAAVVDSFGCWSTEGLDVISEIINRGSKRLITDPQTKVHCYSLATIGMCPPNT